MVFVLTVASGSANQAAVFLFNGCRMKLKRRLIDPSGPTPSIPSPRAVPNPKRIDKIVNLARTHLKRRLIAS